MKCPLEFYATGMGIDYEELTRLTVRILDRIDAFVENEFEFKVNEKGQRCYPPQNKMIVIEDENYVVSGCLCEQHAVIKRRKQLTELAHRVVTQLLAKFGYTWRVLETRETMYGEAPPYGEPDKLCFVIDIAQGKELTTLE